MMDSNGVNVAIGGVALNEVRSRSTFNPAHRDSFDSYPDYLWEVLWITLG
ncbi:hypothetical protein [Stutzerimonas zhaodongensis]